MSKLPKVSAIIPVYNGERYLRQAVESALTQNYTDVEIIVVNDGSTDESGQIANELAIEFPQQVKTVHQANSGLVGARNTAIAHATGELFALLDSDDIWLPNHISESVAVFEKERAVGLVHANIILINSNGHVLHTPNNRRWSTGQQEAWQQIFLRNEHVSCATAVFRRSVIERIGGFDTDFNRLGCEDRDMWLRISAVSNVHYIDAVHAKYRIHESNMSKGIDKMHQARMKLINKHGSESIKNNVIRQAYAAVWRENSESYIGIGDFRRSATSAIRAVQSNPSDIRNWKQLAKVGQSPIKIRVR
jgi:glycosyltransferase involved in cell wall biosynthesis